MACNGIRPPCPPEGGGGVPSSDPLRICRRSRLSEQCGTRLGTAGLRSGRPAKLPPIECICIDHTDGIYAGRAWVKEELALLSAPVFFWPDAPHLPAEYRRPLAIDTGSDSLAGEKREGRPH